MDGKTTMREIEAHKEASKPKREPEPRQVRNFYDLFLKDADRQFNSSKELREYLMSHFANHTVADVRQEYHMTALQRAS